MLRPAAPQGGFFERNQFEAVSRELPPDAQVAVLTGYTYGWRIATEVLPLTWRQVGFEAETLRLAPGTIKNRDGSIVLQAWRVAGQRVGGPHMLGHDFWRSAVRTRLNLRLSERLVMTMVGNRTRSRLDRHRLIAPADLQDAARRMAQTNPRTELGTVRSRERRSS